MNTIPYPCYIPVCGCNGKTYSNPAVAAFNGVSIAYYGECIPFLKNNLYLYFLPASASSKGANNSYWVSDLYILNLQDKEVELTFYFLEKGKENLNPKVANKNIPSSSLISIEDLLKEGESAIIPYLLAMINLGQILVSHLMKKEILK